MSIEMPQAARACANLVGGRPAPGRGPALEVRSPYTGQVIGSLNLSTPEDVADVADAVAAAEAAREGWSRTPLKERTVPLFRFRDVLSGLTDGRRPRP
jgi:malonate-semialdehyde dehydrogenase (acetylating)/methylmalonate-semialdehyde dehydrogenase